MRDMVFIYKRFHRRLVALLRRNFRATVIGFIICFVVYHLRHRPIVPPSRLEPTCPQSSLSDDVLVVIRTGATEAPEKLPVHFQTILKCIPDYILYSDFDEDLDGHHVYDVLDGVSDKVRRDVPEFQLYNHLREHGREGLDIKVQFGSGPAGALENPGWKLDKWKFLPMLDKVLRHRPKAKWFVFIEPDTYLVWPNLLEYLSRMDASKPYYIGKHMYIGDVLFAHGGSGFALSNIAIRKATEQWNAHRDDYDRYVEKSWAGDMVLGKIMKDVGIDLFWAFPHFQGDPLSLLDPNITKINRRPWCFAPITYHHMRKEEVRLFWEFEQDWHRRNKNSTILRHRDVFKEFIIPQLPARRDNWDNLATKTQYSEEAMLQLSPEQKQSLSKIEREAQYSFENCRAVCESKPTCIQFSHSVGVCSISNELKQGYYSHSHCLEYSNAAGKCIRFKGTEVEQHSLSESANPTRSGWMIDRLSDYIQEIDLDCHEDDWVV